MPELPEVETIRLGLKLLLPGQIIVKVDFDWPKSFPNAPGEVDKFMINTKIVDVRRRAKVLMIDLSSGYSLLIHLRMTGQLVYRGIEEFGAGHPNDSLIGELPDKSTRVTIRFKDNARLYFNDQRKFGWMKLVPTAEIPNIDFMLKVGPEPLDPSFTAREFIKRLNRRKKAKIKPVLLDQSIIAGVGNIYADESLFAAKIHPESIVNVVPASQLRKLFLELIKVLNLAIAKGGSTDRNYVNAEGERGSYIDFAKVFRKQGLSCPVCRTEIIKIRVASRGTHICPKCQKLYTIKITKKVKK